MVWYLDTSAAIKLVIEEAESEALAEWVSQPGCRLASSDLLRTELRRVVRKVAPTALTAASTLLGACEMVQVTPAVWDRAATIDPPSLRSLDSVHVAAALELGDELDGIITYDARMAEAAAGLGVAVESPR